MKPGDKYGRLTLLERKAVKNKPTEWLCECSCGTITKKKQQNIISGDTKSCGCLHKEKVRTNRKTHGCCHTLEYIAWTAMNQRCRDTNSECYVNYGGRGIIICERWTGESGFVNFLKDMGPKPASEYSLERIKVNENYCPENCKWGTQEEQSRNKRTNVVLTYNGKTQCLTDWARDLNINISTLKARLTKLKWSVEKSLATPSRYVRNT